MCVDIPVFPTCLPFPGYRSAIGFRGGRGFGDVEGGGLFCELTLVRSDLGQFSSSWDFNWARPALRGALEGGVPYIPIRSWRSRHGPLPVICLWSWVTKNVVLAVRKTMPGAA